MTETLQWDAPGSGSWDGDLTYKLTSFTRPMQELFAPGFEGGFAEVASRYGLPLETIRTAYVNGYGYAQPKPVGAPEKARSSGPPPPLVLKVLSSVHPELRRRNRRARQTFEQRRWREDATRWREQSMPVWLAENRRLQAIDRDHLDDIALAAHVAEAGGHAARGFRHHFSMLGPVLAVGDLLAEAEAQGVDPDAVVPLLAGASPASADGRDRLGRIAAAAGDVSGIRTLDDIRAASDVAGKELDDYLDTYGYRLVGASDLDGRTLVEMPSLVVRAVQAAGSDRAAATPPAALSAELQGLGDRLAEARVAYGVREEEVGITVNWSMGILRHAILAAGERLVARGSCVDRDDVFDLTVEEVEALLLGSGGPAPDEIAARRRARRVADAAPPPPFLGAPPGPPPPPQLFPAPTARILRAMGAYRARISASRGMAPLRGAGIGTDVFRGTACVAASAEDALDRLQPGQVLITSITTPAFNAVLPVAGALVTQEGGLLSHPAIAAREIGIPAVVGAPGVLTIPDGAEVTVDPVAGLVTLEVQP